jgi:hypothetical protein
MAIALVSHGQGDLPGQVRAMQQHAHVTRNLGPTSCMGDLGMHGHAGSGSGEFADVFKTVQQDLSFIGLMQAKRDNTELVDDRLRLTWTVLERYLNKVREKLSRWFVRSFADRASDQPSGVLKQVNGALEQIRSPKGKAQNEAKTRSKMSIPLCSFLEPVTN